ETSSPAAPLLETELKNIQLQIDRAGRLSSALLIGSLILAGGLTALLVLSLHNGVTRKLRSLTLAAVQLQQGWLDNRIQLQGSDEVEQL
ncbi:HAMP domain-containing protein, partial [Enterococcus casseliflavus]|uniref:HAMP domain-containing protein n=1 Tax=Enterococcus casseliflavus TaxID=37734 RepID=UPI003D0D02F0